MEVEDLATQASNHLGSTASILAHTDGMFWVITVGPRPPQHLYTAVFPRMPSTPSGDVRSDQNTGV